MRTIGRILFFLLMSIIIFSSCTQEVKEEGDPVLSTRSANVEVSNYFYVDTSATCDFSNYVNIDTDSIESLISNIDLSDIEYLFENPNIINLQPINDYLSFQNKEEIDLMLFASKSHELLIDENTEFDTLLSFLKNYNIYNELQISHLRNLNTAIELSPDPQSYNNAISNFILSIENDTQLNSFEKFTLISFGKLILLDPNDEELQARGACWDCVKKNKWRIFGWSILTYIGLVLACIVGTGQLIACLLGVIPFSILINICIYCGRKCNMGC